MVKLIHHPPGGSQASPRTDEGRAGFATSTIVAGSPRELIKIRLKYSAKPKKGVYFVSADRDGGTLLHDAQIWTQGETEESRHWFPSYDFPDDKATTEQFLTVEADETDPARRRGPSTPARHRPAAFTSPGTRTGRSLRSPSKPG